MAFFGKRRVVVDDAEVISQNRINLYKQVFKTQEGREVLIDLMDRFHFIQDHKGDPHKEGQRSVVVDIIKHAYIDLRAIDRMISGEEMTG